MTPCCTGVWIEPVNCMARKLLVLVLVLISGCAVSTPAPAAHPLWKNTLTLSPTYRPTRTSTTVVVTQSAATMTPTAVEDTPTASSTATLTSTPRPAYDPESWQELPVVPELSPNARRILENGLAAGNNPNAFSKVGDCESQTTWFLGDFDMGSDYYDLGPYEDELAPVIQHYAGSFNRLSQAAKQGFTAASLFSPLWSDRKTCQKNEAPLACEYRLHQPSVAFILVGTNDATNPTTFEGHIRKVIEYSIEQGVLPVLGTKADNVEGDHHINKTMAMLAYEYDVPLWNYWLAVQDLPGKGLQEDGAHLTFGSPYFSDPAEMENAWPIRNLNALQVLRKMIDVVD